MYDNDYKLSDKQIRHNKAFVEAAIDTYNEGNKVTKTVFETKYQQDAAVVLEHTMSREGRLNRYRSFVETVRSSLVVECMYNMLENAIEPNKRDLTNTSILRAMCSQYVMENGYDNILTRMRTASVTTSEMYKLIMETSARMVDAANPDEPETFVVQPEMKDDFFKSLNYSDSQEISDAIKDRVSAAMDDFVTANTKDHEDIETALQQAQEKIQATPDDQEGLRESYDRLAKQKISKIRNAPKGVLHSMVSAMCESVLKNPDVHVEFMNEGHLDVAKIVDRVSLMYTFMEMLNTSRLEKVDKAFVENVIADLKK